MPCSDEVACSQRIGSSAESGWLVRHEQWRQITSRMSTSGMQEILADCVRNSVERKRENHSACGWRKLRAASGDLRRGFQVIRPLPRRQNGNQEKQSDR